MKPLKVNRKPINCHKCNQKTVVKILYGEPTEESWELAEQGKLVLGGCCSTEKSPKWQCTFCKTKYKR